MSQEKIDDSTPTKPQAGNWEKADNFNRNKRHYFWHGLLSAMRWVVPRPARALAFESVAAIAPRVPTTLANLSTGSKGWRVFFWSAAIGLLLCYGMTRLITTRAGTWHGTEPNTVYFSQDIYNQILYIVVCPIYIGLCVWIVSLFLSRGTELGSLADELKAPQLRFRKIGFPLSVALILTLSAFFIVLFIRDVLSTRNVPQGYWFMTAPIGGDRYLNMAGSYYVILNFGLLVLTLVTIGSFITLFFDMLRVGQAINRHTGQAPLDFATMTHRLASFTEAYLIAKILCAVYIINIVIWRLSPLGATANVHVASIAIAAMGLFFISFPRYYVEIEWRNLQERTGVEIAGFQDIRRSHQRVIVGWIDAAFITTFIFNYASLASEENTKDVVRGWLAEVLKALGAVN